MSSILSRRKIADAFEFEAEQSAGTEAGGLTRAQAEEVMCKEVMEIASDIADVDSEAAVEVLHEHLPPWMRREAENRLI